MNVLARILLALALSASLQLIATGAARDAALEGAFINTSGWTGGDAAYSVPLSNGHNLWLFGDSFYGNIEHGKRVRMEMVHNSAAWQNLAKPAQPLRFFINITKDGAADLFAPPPPSHEYYWPGVALMAKGKLALFCKRIATTSGGDPAFNFKWTGADLMLISNPTAEPNRWLAQTVPLPGSEAGIMPGAAAVVADHMAYIFGTLENSASKGHPCILMRIPASALACGDMTKLQYWCHQSNEHGEQLSQCDWSNTPIFPAVLFDDGAPEFTVNQVNGIPGFLAVYSPHGLSDTIAVRHADKPEGPWSAPVVVYQHRGLTPGELCYGAKNHPELAPGKRSLCISYSLNPGGAEQHRVRPYDYFPKFVRVTLSAAD